MFTNVMEVDSSLDEFARALAANGYMNDESCFVDSDFPAMLSAFEAGDPLDSADSFLAGSYVGGDLSRVLDLAQIAGQTLMDTCIPDSYVHSKTMSDTCLRDSYVHFKTMSDTIMHDSYVHSKTISETSIHDNYVHSKTLSDTPIHDNYVHSKTLSDTSIHDNYVHSKTLSDTSMHDNYVHSKTLSEAPIMYECHSRKLPDSCLVMDDSLHNLHAPPSKGNNCSNAFFQDSNCISNNPLNFNVIHVEQPESLRSSNYKVCVRQPDTCNNPIEDLHYRQTFHYNVQENFSNYHGTDSQGQLYSAFEGESIEGEKSESFSAKGKQKKKRRSKGYSKSGKSRRKKNNKASLDSELPPKPKKPKMSKNCNKEAKNSNKEMNNFSGNSDVPHEDSGFESGDKNMPETPDSEGGSGIVESFESIAQEEQPKTLRRSSRATRNTENYNFRLSSLVKRVETERRQQEPRQPKDKIKPAPLSKYRRRTANARERDRMKDINDAFDKLKGTLPSIHRDDGKQKITKFTILKHALNYIASLREILGFEYTPISNDDDFTSESSSVRPASVASSGGEDSCSSAGSSPSASSPELTRRTSTFSISDPPGGIYENPAVIDTTSEQNLLPPNITQRTLATRDSLFS